MTACQQLQMLLSFTVLDTVVSFKKLWLVNGLKLADRKDRGRRGEKVRERKLNSKEMKKEPRSTAGSPSNIITVILRCISSYSAQFDLMKGAGHRPTAYTLGNKTPSRNEVFLLFIEVSLRDIQYIWMQFLKTHRVLIFLDFTCILTLRYYVDRVNVHMFLKKNIDLFISCLCTWTHVYIFHRNCVWMILLFEKEFQ